MFKAAEDMRLIALDHNLERYKMARTGLANYIENMANVGHYEICANYDNLFTYEFLDKISEELQNLGYKVSLQEDNFTIRW